MRKLSPAIQVDRAWEYAMNVMQTWDKDLAQDQTKRFGEGVRERHYCYASGRKDCVRAMALDLIHPEDRPMFDGESLERMKKGNEREDDIVIRLQRLGRIGEPRWNVNQSQRRLEIHDQELKCVIIVGKIDGMIEFEDGMKAVFDVKSGEAHKNCRTIEDLDSGLWTSHTIDQVLAYLLEEGLPLGFVVIDRPGMPHIIPIILEDNLDRAQGFLNDAKHAVAAKRGLLPLPDYTRDQSLCRRCDHFLKSCTPETMEMGAGVTVVYNETDIDTARQMVELKPGADRYKRAHARMKDVCQGKEHVILGDVLITSSFGKLTTYNVPVDIKAQYKHVDPKGRQILKATMIVDKGATQ